MIAGMMMPRMPRMTGTIEQTMPVHETDMTIIMSEIVTMMLDEHHFVEVIAVPTSTEERRVAR